jgi:hypothetical protein
VGMAHNFFLFLKKYFSKFRENNGKS